MLDKVLEIVQKKGPVLPVEVASELNINSFLASAYLKELVESKQIKASKKNIGESFLYFMPDQSAKAEARTKTILAQTTKTARTYAKNVETTPEIQAKRQAFAERLREIEEKEAKEKAKTPAIQKAKISEKEKADFLGRFAPKIEMPEKPSVVSAAKEIVKSALKMKESKQKAPASKVLDKAQDYLDSAGIEVISKEIKKKGKEADLFANIQTQIGELKVLVKVKDKKRINEADLSHAYAEGLNKKMPVLLVTNGKLTKTAQNYTKVIGGLLKVKILE